MWKKLRIGHIKAGGLYAEVVMSRWTDEELRELTTLWPTHSVSQLVEQLHRPRWAIRSKAKRLRLDGMRLHSPSEDDEANNLPKRRPLRAGPYGRGRRSQGEGGAKLDGAATRRAN